MLPTVAQSGFAQTPLNFSNNFFVTGDYIVAGAYNMTKSFTTINGVSYAVGTINVPDTNPGIKGATSVPTGAQVIAALLYWQTVEKTTALGSGANGYFRPLLYAGKGGPAAPGYLIQGTPLVNEIAHPVPTGCSGTSNGKVIQTYRADVAGGLPVDTSGNSSANGSFEVRLPSTNNGQPFALGATLVIIYRIPAGAGGPNIPLNSILIFDGAYAQNNLQPTMTQPMPGPYGAIDTDASTVTRLTHIVGSGQSNKFETVSLGPNTSDLTNLPSLYGKLPSFPGYYGTWDNPTWMFPTGSPLANDSIGAATQVAPAPMNQACVSWGAVIMSTTVKNSDNDGILDSWKNSGGYCDYLSSPSCGGPADPTFITLPGAKMGEKDIYLHYDYLCSTVNNGKCLTSPPIPPAPLSGVGAAIAAGTATYTGSFSPAPATGAVVTVSGFKNAANNGQFVVSSSTTSQLVVKNANAVAENNPGTATYGDYSFDPTLAINPLDNKDAVQEVVDTFNSHKGSPGTEPFVLHIERGNAVQEKQTSCADTDRDQNGNLTCIFPNEPGTVGFREGLAWIKNSTIDTGTGLLGCGPSSASCVGFQHGKKDSYHYALFSHGVGLTSWSLSDKSLQTVTQGSVVTFTTKSPHGLTPISGDSVCSNANGYIGRVTVVYAITNPNLNGTFCATWISGTQFSITLPKKPVFAGTVLSSYTVKTDPNLSVADGNVTSMSGYSDLGGQNSVISLGEGGWAPAQNWVPPSEGNKWNVKAGTFMHELGHTLGLTHGGAFYNSNPNNGNSLTNDYTPTYEANCKPNVQSVMSYVFQFDLLKTNQTVNQAPVKVLDFSEDPDSDFIPTLTEGNGDTTGLGNLAYPFTSWFTLSNGPFPSNHCDGSPTVQGENSYVYTNQPIGAFTFTAGQDINFNGSTTDLMHPHNEWEGTAAAADGLAGPSPGVDLQQVSAAGTVSAIGPGGEAGGLKPSGTGGGLKPAGTGGGLKPAGTGGAGFTPAGGGGGYKPAGTGGAPIDITHNQASSYPRPPDNLFIQQEEASPRVIDLNWFAASFGTALQYNIYQSTDGTNFTNIGSVPGSQTSTKVTVTCSNAATPPNPLGYFYQVKAVTVSDSGIQTESSPSNTVPAPGEPPLTGCYTVNHFTVPASAVQGTAALQISWTLTDDFFITAGDIWANAKNNTNNAVTKLTASTLVAIGPDPNNCSNPNNPVRTTLLADGTPTNAGKIGNGDVVGADAFAGSAANTNQFTFTWNRTDGFCAGSYSFELDLDHVNGSPAQTQAGPNGLQLGVDINDQDAPNINDLLVPDGTVGVFYTNTFTQHGGVGTITWSISQGSLPIGIALNTSTGTISGYATTACQCQFTVTATDSKGNIGSQQVNLVTHIWVSASPAPATPPFVANPTLSPMTVGISSPDTMYQSGAVGAVRWSISQGSAPTSVTLDPNTGVLSGYAGTACTCQFTVLATDKQGNTGTLAFTLVVHIFVSASPAPANPPFTATAVLLPDATVGVPYSNTVYESGGVTGANQFAWIIVEGSAPGLMFAANSGGATNGTLTGAPTAVGVYAFTAQVTDSAGNTGTQMFTLTVHLFVSDAQPFTVNPILPDAIVGAAYSNTPFESGGTGPFTWTVTAGTNPPGLQFNSASGTLSGTPTAPGTYNFTVKVTDNFGNVGSQSLTLTVLACTVTPSGLVSWYPFNGNALDIRGGKPGTLVGSGGTFVPADVNQGFKSGGEGSVITVPGAAYLNPANFTVGAWIRLDAISDDPTMLIVWQGDNVGTDLSTPYSLGVQGNGAFTNSAGAKQIGTPGSGKVFAIISDGTNELDVFSNTVLTPGFFYYVTLTWSGPEAGASLYVNGALENSAGNTQLVGLAPPVNPFQIGGILNGDDSFNGVIDELQIWLTALTQAQIAPIYNLGSAGQCNTLWFSEESANKVGRINADGSGVSGFPIATAANANPYGVAAGPDGNAWLSEYGTGNIAMITPGGAVTEFPTLTASSGPIGMAAGPDGQLWFVEYNANQVASITTAGTVKEFPTIGTNPYAITAGPDGNLWFTEFNGNRIGKITPSGVLTEYPIPTTTSTPSGITAGPDGNLWFTELKGNKIGVITPAGAISEYAITTASSQPNAITVGADGNLWFTEAAGNKIGVISPSGTVLHEYLVPTANSSPFAIASGLDGNVWFTETNGNQIGRITPTGVITEFPINDANGFPVSITEGP
jgi:streptogramin lyase